MEVDQASVERRYAIARVRQVAAMVFFGAAVGILLTFLGGLMAIDYVPKWICGGSVPAKVGEG